MNFMSPERLYGNPYTTESDIWSAGMTLLVGKLGKFPFEGTGEANFWELVGKLEVSATGVRVFRSTKTCGAR